MKSSTVRTLVTGLSFYLDTLKSWSLAKISKVSALFCRLVFSSIVDLVTACAFRHTDKDVVFVCFISIFILFFLIKKKVHIVLNSVCTLYIQINIHTSTKCLTFVRKL